MSFTSTANFIHCSFDQGKDSKSGSNTEVVEVFFAKTKDVYTEFHQLKKYIDNSDRLKANRLHLDEDRDTYLLCHTLLRFLVSRKLNIKPSEVIIVYDKNNKPGLQGDRLFFNISHTREAFAFAISEKYNLGLDLEKVDRKLDFRSIIRTFFSDKEREFILKSPGDPGKRFFLLWTRKEALLKAIGTGIISDLSHIEVFRQENILNRKSFNNLTDGIEICDHFIYSEKILNYYLSVAVPQRAKIFLHRLKMEKIKSSLELLTI